MRTVQFKRKRQGKTNYKKRLKLLMSNKLRLVIRKSLNNLTAQIIEYHPEGDRIVCSTHSSELEKYGWNLNKSNLPASYLTGLLLGKKAKEKKITEAILDIGLNSSTKGSRIYAALKGVIDSGIGVPHSKEVLPQENRIKGEHTKTKDVLKKFEEVKKKISG